MNEAWIFLAFMPVGGAIGLLAIRTGLAQRLFDRIGNRPDHRRVVHGRPTGVFLNERD